MTMKKVFEMSTEELNEFRSVLSKLNKMYCQVRDQPDMANTIDTAISALGCVLFNYCCEESTCFEDDEPEESEDYDEDEPPEDEEPEPEDESFADDEPYKLMAMMAALRMNWRKNNE